MAVYISRQVDLGTSGAWQAANAIVSETRGDIIVPPGMNSIKEIWLVPGQSATFTTTKGALFAFRIRGLGRTYELCAGGLTNGTIATKDGFTITCPATVVKTNVSVIPGQSLTLEGAQVTDADAGTPYLGVTLVFDASAGAQRWSFFRYQSTLTAVDTKYAMTLDAVNATVGGVQLPGNVHHITNIVGAVGGICGTAALGGTGLLRLEGGMTEGDQVLTIGGQASLDTNDGAGTMIWNPAVIPTDIAVSPFGIINCYGEQCGVDWGTPMAGCSIEVE